MSTFRVNTPGPSFTIEAPSLEDAAQLMRDRLWTPEYAARYTRTRELVTSFVDADGSTPRRAYVHVKMRKSGKLVTGAVILATREQQRIADSIAAALSAGPLPDLSADAIERERELQRQYDERQLSRRCEAFVDSSCELAATTSFVIVDSMSPESGLRQPLRLCDEHASVLRHDAAVETTMTIVSETPIVALVVPAPHDPSDDSTQPAHDVDDTLSAQQRKLIEQRRSELGSGELAGGDVQPLTRKGKHGVRRNRRHDQTPEQIEAKLAERRGRQL